MGSGVTAIILPSNCPNLIEKPRQFASDNHGMARVARLEPRFSRREKRWRLNVPPELSPTGKRRREFFETEELAKRRAAQLTAVRESKSASVARWAQPELIAAAVECEARAVELGFSSLSEAFTTMSEEWSYRHATPRLGDLLRAHEADHGGNWSDKYRSDRWKPFRKILVAIEDEKIGRLDSDFWRRFLAKWREKKSPAPATYNQALSMLRTIFRHEIARRHTSFNPLDPIPSIVHKREEVAVSDPGHVRALLEWCHENDAELVPYFVLGYFAGLRPQAELAGLRFEHIDHNARLIDVRSTKTRRRRHVPLEGNAAAWLRPWARRKGPVCPKNLRRRIDAAREGAAKVLYGPDDDMNPTKPFPWGHDIMRHSYGSFWEAAHRKEAGCRDILVYNMGHTTFRTFDQHYRNDRTSDSAEKFWSIVPPKGERVIQIA